MSLMSLTSARWTWGVLCWGDRLTAGFADVLRQVYHSSRRNSGALVCHTRKTNFIAFSSWVHMVVIFSVWFFFEWRSSFAKTHNSIFTRRQKRSFLFYFMRSFAVWTKSNSFMRLVFSVIFCIIRLDLFLLFGFSKLDVRFWD